MLTPAWVLMWIVVWAASAPWRHALLYDAHWTWLLVPPLWTISLYIYFGGNRHFTVNQVIGRNELEPERHEPSLVTTGLHSRMRHPLYFGHLCTMLGWTIGTATIATLALTVFAVLSGIFLIRTEDAELERRFGVSYREYKQRVPAVVPHFRA
ncbi:MAG TPA: isoprenylcysteine carboxylmethyltransferase family protein [Clostridia bacterium]|nr:isoprenylcysteine carboxylmethyltransferase family protein [Clostridia bacterium]